MRGDRTTGTGGGNPNGRGTGERRDRSSGVSPLVGDDFRDWSERLEDVESLIPSGPLRDEATRIRERAELMRRDYLRHSLPPDEATIGTAIAEPLERLTLEIAAERRRLEGKDAAVRLDRDEIPQRFEDQVRRYFERLGAGRE
ncbi:MAG TPA: hypothetical protein DCQ98_08215 [Planctomycetaceae bacterium]|nr:hypothetical protein [Planctomycetaceae bacterium]HRF00988.1 hypothetical protein [Pirellulaceae bacterium]